MAKTRFGVFIREGRQAAEVKPLSFPHRLNPTCRPHDSFRPLGHTTEPLVVLKGLPQRRMHYGTREKELDLVEAEGPIGSPQDLFNHVERL